MKQPDLFTNPGSAPPRHRLPCNCYRYFNTHEATPECLAAVGGGSGQIEKASAARDSGIARAVEHADDERPDWHANAVKTLAAWVPGRGDFMTEEFVTFAEATVGEPPDPRAWGGVITTAVRRGIVKRVGVGVAKNISTHRGLRTIWRAA